ncbi:MAG: bifunctional riboflavin kinase/FAD synthetase [Fimbriimonadaceae bacterium]
MLIHFGPDHLNPEWAGSVVCIGTFDGVHLGHQTLIKKTVELGHQKHLPSVVLTFDRHPAEILAPDHAPLPINTLDQNLDLINALGVSATVILPFNQKLADCPAEQFYQTILKNHLKAESIVIGHDFAFGHNRQGTPDWLQQRIETHILEPVEINHLRVSSSQIRHAIKTGNCEVAAQLLGRPFQIKAPIVAGQQLGRTLGYPTANLARSSNLCSLPHGIYACQAETPFGLFTAAASIGTRPTVQGTHPTIEAFLLDYTGESLYGHIIALDFHHRLRDELKFNGLEELKSQMAIDVQQTRQIIASATSNH